MKLVLDANADYHMEFDMPEFPKIDNDNIVKHSDLPFNSINDVKAIVDQLSAQVSKKEDEQLNVNIKMSDLQTKLLKSKRLPFSGP